MQLALDTNTYVDFCKGEKYAVEAIQKADAIFLPLICLAELRAGFLWGSKSLKNERGLIQFLNSPRVEILVPDEETTHHYARLFFQLRKQGTPIPANDLWIAALVAQHNLSLLSRDRHFDHLSQIPRS